MNNNNYLIDKPFELDSIFIHDRLFQANRNIFYLSNNRYYVDKDFNNQLIELSEVNNKTIENIIYFSLLLKTRLRQKLLTEIFKAINEIDCEIKKNDLNTDLKSKLEKEKESIFLIFINEVDETENLINEHVLFITSKINFLKTQFITEKIITVIKNSEDVDCQLSKSISTLEGECREIKSNLDIIRESEEILHKRSFFELFSSSIPNIDEINKLNIEKKEKSVLIAFVDMLNKLFSIVQSGFSYSKLVDYRHQLTDLYLNKTKELTHIKNKKQNNTFVLAHYYSLKDIDYYLKHFINQLVLLNNYWNDLIVKIKIIKEEKENIQFIEENINPILLFLDDFTAYTKK